MKIHTGSACCSAEGALDQSDDGLVPYRSAHLPGAVSEKVIVSGHSVQEGAAAILELRRILHGGLAQRTRTRTGSAAETGKRAAAGPASALN